MIHIDTQNTQTPKQPNLPWKKRHRTSIPGIGADTDGEIEEYGKLLKNFVFSNQVALRIHITLSPPLPSVPFSIRSIIMHRERSSVVAENNNKKSINQSLYRIQVYIHKFFFLLSLENLIQVHKVTILPIGLLCQIQITRYTGSPTHFLYATIQHHSFRVQLITGKSIRCDSAIDKAIFANIPAAKKVPSHQAHPPTKLYWPARPSIFISPYLTLFSPAPLGKNQKSKYMYMQNINLLI